MAVRTAAHRRLKVHAELHVPDAIPVFEAACDGVPLPGHGPHPPAEAPFARFCPTSPRPGSPPRPSPVVASVPRGAGSRRVRPDALRLLRRPRCFGLQVGVWPNPRWGRTWSAPTELSITKRVTPVRLATDRFRALGARPGPPGLSSRGLCPPPEPAREKLTASIPFAHPTPSCRSVEITLAPGQLPEASALCRSFPSTAGARRLVALIETNSLNQDARAGFACGQPATEDVHAHSGDPSVNWRGGRKSDPGGNHGRKIDFHVDEFLPCRSRQCSRP